MTSFHARPHLNIIIIIRICLRYAIGIIANLCNDNVCNKNYLYVCGQCTEDGSHVKNACILISILHKHTYINECQYRAIMFPIHSLQRSPTVCTHFPYLFRVLRCFSLTHSLVNNLFHAYFLCFLCFGVFYFIIIILIRSWCDRYHNDQCKCPAIACDFAPSHFLLSSFSLSFFHVFGNSPRFYTFAFTINRINQMEKQRKHKRYMKETFGHKAIHIIFTINSRTVSTWEIIMCACETIKTI